MVFEKLNGIPLDDDRVNIEVVPIHEYIDE
jgi:hypothetical protein